MERERVKGSKWICWLAMRGRGKRWGCRNKYLRRARRSCGSGEFRKSLRRFGEQRRRKNETRSDMDERGIGGFSSFTRGGGRRAPHKEDSHTTAGKRPKTTAAARPRRT